MSITIVHIKIGGKDAPGCSPGHYLRMVCRTYQLLKKGASGCNCLQNHKNMI
jgi:hypothetical protein